MASRIFAPITKRLRRKVNDRERLVENDINLLLQKDLFCEAHDNGITTQEAKEQARETCFVSTVSSDVGNNYAVERHDDSGRGGNTATIKRTKPAKKRVAFVGIILAMTSALFFSSSALFIKLAESIPSVEVSFIRLTIQLAFALPPMIFFKDEFIYPWKKTKVLVLRGVIGVTAMTLSIYTIKHIPLADARVIFFTTPVHTAILGRIFLKESISKFDVIAMLLSIGGVILIARPTFLFGSHGEASGSMQVWVSTFLAVVGPIAAAFSTILTRKMSQEVGVRVVIFYFLLVGTIMSFPASMISEFKYPDCGTYDAIYIIVAAFLGYGGKLLATKALSMEKASVVSLVRTIGLVYSFIFQITILDNVPSGLSIGGAVLVLLCNVCIFLKKFSDMERTYPNSSKVPKI